MCLELIKCCAGRIIREQVVAVARTYIGTPFKHQGRVKGKGVDCAGLIICVAHELGLSTWDTRNYGKTPIGSLMRSIILEHMDEIPIAAAGPGDMLHIAWECDPQHVALISENRTVIHAHSKLRRVTEHGFDTRWNVHAAFRFRVPWLFCHKEGLSECSLL